MPFKLPSHSRLWAEFLILFGGAPLLVLAIRERWFMVALMWGSAAMIAFVLHKFYKRRHAVEWNWPGFRAGIGDVLLQVAAVTPIFVMILWLFLPESFLSLPRERFELWVRIMFLYPLLSVWPQELVYRSFIYHRYQPIFGKEKYYIAASTLAFAWMHIIFLNSVAVLLTLCGGYLFSRSYAKNNSLALVCAEHALYGCMLFTVGYGWFFFSGAAWR